MGVLKRISDKIAEMRKRSRDKKDFLESILDAASDGVLTDAEIAQISARQTELGLADEDLRKVRVQAYNAAFWAAKNDGVVTRQEEKELTKLQQFLKIPESEIAKTKKELARLRLINEIESGNLPSTSVTNLILQKGEIAHWCEAGDIMEERVVSRRYQGGSQGVSVRIAKGVSYRIGSHRGHLITDTAVIPVSSGELIVTNKRVVFRGDNKSFSLRFDKLLDVHFFRNAVRVTGDKGKPHLVQFDDEDNSEIVGAVLSFAINNFAG
jgi:hypothetical protein